MNIMNIGALSGLSRPCWRTSVGFARPLALKWSQEPHWKNGGESTKLRSREFTFFCSSLGVFLLFNWVFFVATQSHDSKKTARSWKIRIPARDWVVVIFMDWRMMLGSMDQSITSHKISARPNISKHRRMQSRVFRIVRLFILVLGIFPIDLHPEFWIARGASFLWHHLRRPKTSKSKMWKFGNLTRW